MAKLMLNGSLVIGEPPRNEAGDLTLTGAELKAAVKGAINHIAFLKLRQTDWYVTRNIETSDPIPQAITDARAAIRARANDLESQVAAAPDDDAVLAVDVTFSDL